MFSTALIAQIIDLNIILLTIKTNGEILDQDNFFEIIDMNDYILVPALGLSRWLDFELDYNRDQERLVLTDPDTGNNVTVDLAEEEYIGHPLWNVEPPISFEGDFYLSTYLYQYLFGGEFEWIPRRQELILADAISIEEELLEDELIIPEREVREYVEPDIYGLDVSIGSIQYKVGFDYLIDQGGDGRIVSFNQVNLHGRAGDWAISSSQRIRYDLDRDELELNIPLIRARNAENDRLINLGDASINLHETTGRSRLRGLLYQYPLIQSNRLRAFTSVSGFADEGDTVRVYANGSFIAEEFVYAGEDSYEIRNIPLSINRTNIIYIVIEDIEGNQQEIVREISGHPRILQEDTMEGVFLLGRYRSGSSSDWSGNILGVDIRTAMTDNISLRGELAIDQDLENDSEIELGGVLGLAVRMDFPVVFTLDWMIGGNLNNFESGLDTNLIYTMEAGSVKAGFSYIPEETSAKTSFDDGQRTSIELERQLNPNWAGVLGGLHYRNIDDLSDDEYYQIYVGSIYRGAERNRFSLRLSYLTRELIEDLTAEEISVFDIDEYGLDLSGSIRLLNSNISAGLNIRSSDYYLNGNEYQDRLNLDLETGIRLQLSDSILISADVDNSYLWVDGERQSADRTIELTSRFNLADNLAADGSVTSFSASNEEDELETISSQYELALRYNYSPYLRFNAGIRNSYLLNVDDNYLTARGGLLYTAPDRQQRLTLDLSYLTSVGVRETSQERASINYTRELFSGLELNLQAARTYQSIFAEDPEYRISISLSQVLGFARNAVIGQRFSRDEHISYVGGFVYLDENGNGQYDPGEPVLSDISISMDGLRTRTDENGEFIFENVRPGLYEVGFDIRNLPADYNIVTESKMVRIRENENMYLTYGLSMDGTVSGRIYLDRGVTGTREPGDDPISWVGLEIVELNKRVFSRNDGTFYFENIPLGDYTLKVLTETLPGGQRISGPIQYEFSITQDSLNIRGIEFPVIYGTSN